MGVARGNNLQIAIASFALFCIALVLTAFSAKHPETSQYGEILISEIVAPFENVSYALRGGVSGMWRRYFALVDTQEQNQELHQRIASLESDLARLREFEHENKNLKELLAITKQSELRGIVAEVIGLSPSLWVQSLTINRGIADGIKPGMAVIQGEGVVGQIMKVGRSTAEVLLISDHVSGVDAIVQRTRARGVVEGSGGELCRMRYVSQEEEIQVGDRIITSGKDGIYPKGLLLGVVSDVDTNSRAQFKLIEIHPTVDFSRVESVLVLTVPVVPEKSKVEGK